MRTHRKGRANGNRRRARKFDEHGDGFSYGSERALFSSYLRELVTLAVEGFRLTSIYLKISRTSDVIAIWDGESPPTLRMRFRIAEPDPPACAKMNGMRLSCSQALPCQV